MTYRKKISLFVVLTVLLPNALAAEKEVFIDLALQKIYAIEDGETAFEGRISSGKAGHETPTGYFKILQKKRRHISNLYPEPNGGAKMPYMMRLTWDGVAMHQGYVPKRPASHGCIRLQRHFAKKLFNWANKGTPVTIGGDIGRHYDYGVEGYAAEGYAIGKTYEQERDGYAIIEVY